MRMTWIDRDCGVGLALGRLTLTAGLSSLGLPAVGASLFLHRYVLMVTLNLTWLYFHAEWDRTSSCDEPDREPGQAGRCAEITQKVRKD